MGHTRLVVACAKEASRRGHHCDIKARHASTLDLVATLLPIMHDDVVCLLLHLRYLVWAMSTSTKDFRSFENRTLANHRSLAYLFEL